MIPVVITGDVVASERDGAYQVLEVRSREIASGSRPGQFVNIAVDPCNGMFRIPFSVAWTDELTGTFAIVFDPIGAGTTWLAQRSPGDTVSIVGPLGRGYRLDGPEGADLLIGGGYGAAALVGLAEALKDRGRQPTAILGARSAERLLIASRMTEACSDVIEVTEDGSAGRTGRVTDILEEVVRDREVGSIFACGPNPMLAAVAREARRLGVKAELAVEEFMACGIGVCWTCVIPVNTPDGIAHQRACTEGPVFSSEELAWA